MILNWINQFVLNAYKRFPFWGTWMIYVLWLRAQLTEEEKNDLRVKMPKFKDIL